MSSPCLIFTQARVQRRVKTACFVTKAEALIEQAGLCHAGQTVADPSVGRFSSDVETQAKREACLKEALKGRFEGLCPRMGLECETAQEAPEVGAPPRNFPETLGL